MNDTQVLQNYIAVELELYDRLVRDLTARGARRFGMPALVWATRAQQNWQGLNRASIAIPPSLLAPYDIDHTAFNAAGTMMKYRLRGYNTLRELHRIAIFCPELLHAGPTCQVLELGAGSCANKDVLEHFGHTVTLADDLAGMGAAYAPIHQTLDVAPIQFDGTTLPYSFAEQSFDYVFCNQAIDAFGPIDIWPDILAQMQRITRKKLVVVFNPDYSRDMQRLENFVQGFCAKGATARTARCPDTGLPALVLDCRTQAVVL